MKTLLVIACFSRFIIHVANLASWNLEKKALYFYLFPDSFTGRVVILSGIFFFFFFINRLTSLMQTLVGQC